MAAAERENIDLAEFHRARYWDVTEDDELRMKSAQWFLDRGFVGLDGKQILPFGELPR